MSFVGEGWAFLLSYPVAVFSSFDVFWRILVNGLLGTRTDYSSIIWLFCTTCLDFLLLKWDVMSNDAVAAILAYACTKFELTITHEHGATAD